MCAFTVTDQFGMSSTEKLAVNVVPDTVCVTVPPPSLPVIVTVYWSIGLLPGTAAGQVAMMVSVVPEGSGFDQVAVTPVGADGATVAGDVVTLMGAEAGPDPLMLVTTTVIWYVVCGWSGEMIVFVAELATLVVRTEAVELTGVAVTVAATTAAGLIPVGIHET